MAEHRLCQVKLYLSHNPQHVSLRVQVRWWDVTVGKQDFRLEGHTDYVRSAAVSPSSQDIWATAGYDHICKLWDVRSQECVMNLDHGAPIEDVAFFPSGISNMLAGASSQNSRTSVPCT